MKVLLYPLVNHDAIGYPLQNCDYMLDCVFHGLRSLLGADCVDYYSLDHMYDDYPNPIDLYGNGFTIYARLPRIEVDRTDLEIKIAKNYFDQIIIPIHNNRFMYDGNLEIIRSIVDLGNKVKIIDGNDSPKIQQELIGLAPFFKREFLEKRSFYNRQVHPISFAIPEDYIVEKSNVYEKDKLVSDILPKAGGRVNWTYTIEEEYCNEYRRSVFAHTRKKGGWDCMRHYEIIGNGCLPLFYDIESCPEMTLTTLPHQDLIRIKDLAKAGIDAEEATMITEKMLDYARANLTTKILAKTILERD